MNFLGPPSTTCGSLLFNLLPAPCKLFLSLDFLLLYLKQARLVLALSLGPHQGCLIVMERTYGLIVRSLVLLEDGVDLVSAHVCLENRLAAGIYLALQVLVRAPLSLAALPEFDILVLLIRLLGVFDHEDLRLPDKLVHLHLQISQNLLLDHVLF